MTEPAPRKNRLAQESSPYLLLHQDNPVDWYPWGSEALEKARREDKPIFLSVGYSTCYWCHVMERESFSDPAVAEVLNRWFVPIKVDREERPDLDEIYMAATQILSQHGGWPNSVFLTPQLEPFYAGTYFPPEGLPGRPGFRSLLESLHDAWVNRRKDLEQHADEVAAALGRYLEGRGQLAGELPEAEAALRSLEQLARTFDAEHGGFGAAPKFPTPANLFLLAELAPAEPRAAQMLQVTLDRMARGGLYDQLGGGFHRYATDRQWKVPHFEKMLYDNGFLLEVYAREHTRTGDPERARVARETGRFLAREMTGDHGAFLSAIDAETAGKEGAFYAWTRAELVQVLGEEDAAFLAPLLGFDGAPFFEEDEYVLHLPRPLAEVAAARRMGVEALWAEVSPLTARLLAARAGRPRPLTDDKVLADWNGIAIAGMAVAGRLLPEPDFTRRAGAAAGFVLDHLWPDTGAGRRGPLLHAWRAGNARIPAFLADYAFLVRGLLELHGATREVRWRKAAEALAEEQIERLRDPQGGFFDAAPASDLLFRSKSTFDGALPAANAVSALNFLTLAEGAGDPRAAARWRQEAVSTLRSMGRLLTAYPEAVRMAAVAVHRLGERGAAAPAAPSPMGAAQEEADLAVLARARWVGDADEEGLRPFGVSLVVAPGSHVNANPATLDFLVPTRLEARGGRLADLRYPPGQPLATALGGGGEIAVYSGQVEIRGKVAPAADGALTLLLTYQVCDEKRCLPPRTRELPLR